MQKVTRPQYKLLASLPLRVSVNYTPALLLVAKGLAEYKKPTTYGFNTLTRTGAGEAYLKGPHAKEK